MRIGGVIRTAEYREIFRNSPGKAFDVPYYLTFFGLMAGLATSFVDIQEAVAIKAEQVEFVFDDQPGQMEKVLGSWHRASALAHSIARPAPDQGRRHRACQQNCADGVGDDGQGRRI